MRTLLTLLLLSSLSLAADISVPIGGSIQAAMDLAAPGDRVLVPGGTYLQTIDFNGKAIEVLGVAGPTQTILDASGVGTVASFKSGEGTGSRLTGVTLTGGNGGYGGGGGIGCSSGSTPVISDCIVRSNVGKLGAGVAGSPIMERCVITLNTSSLNHGGGLYGAPTLKQCVVASNTASSADGGGLYVKNGKSVVEDTVFFDNRAVFAGSKGGGIYVGSGGSLDLSGSVMVGNYSTGGTFGGYGGAIFGGSTTTVEGCTIVGNSASGSSTHGGGIYGAAVVRNSIVRDNTGGDLELVTATYCDVTGGYPGVGNVDLDPAFVDEPGRDYHLGLGSPVIDLGDPSTFDPDGTIADLGAHAFMDLYTLDNVGSGDWADPAWDNLSSLLGGKLRLRVLAGAAYAGDLYWVLGSASGTAPGFNLAGTLVPLNLDSYTLMTLTQPNGPGLAGFLGVLDGDGLGDATLSVPGDLTSSLAGITVSHAALYGQPNQVAPPVTSVLDFVLQ